MFCNFLRFQAILTIYWGWHFCPLKGERESRKVPLPISTLGALLEITMRCLLPSAKKLRRLCFYRHLSVHRGGVCLSACWDTPPGSIHAPPWEQTHPPEQTLPPLADTPPEQTPPWEQTTIRADTPWEQTPPPQDTAIAADGTHPTGMHSCYELRFLSKWCRLQKPCGCVVHCRH